MRNVRPNLLALVLSLAALRGTAAQDNSEIRQKRAAILERYAAADGEKRRQLAVELARLDYHLAAAPQAQAVGVTSRGPRDTLSQLDALDRAIRDLQADVDRLRDLLESGEGDAVQSKVQLLHDLGDIEDFRRQKMAIVATDPIGAALEHGLVENRDEIVRVLRSLIDATGTGPGGDPMVGKGFEAEVALEIPGTALGLKGDAKGQVNLGRSGESFVVSNIFQGSSSGTVGLDGKIDGGMGFKGFGAEFELAAGTQFEARVLFQFDPDRPEDLMGILGKVVLLVDEERAAALFSRLFPDDSLAAIGPSGPSAREKRAALAKLLAAQYPSSWKEGIRNSRESDRVSPNLALFAKKALEGLGGDPGTATFSPEESARILRLVAEMEGRNDRNRKSRQMTFRLDAGLKGAIKTPLIDQELGLAGGVGLFGFEERILPDGTRVEGTVSTRYYSMEGKAAGHTPHKKANAGVEGSVGRQTAITVKEFRDATGKVRRIEVAVRNVTSEAVALKGGLEVAGKLEASAAGTNVESVVDTFVRDDPSAEQGEDLSSALDLGWTDLVLGDAGPFAETLEEDFFFDALDQVSHTRTTTVQSAEALKAKAEGGVFQAKVNWVGTSGHTGTETLFGEADRGHGAAVENLGGDVDASSD